MLLRDKSFGLHLQPHKNCLAGLHIADALGVGSLVQEEAGTDPIKLTGDDSYFYFYFFLDKFV